MADPAKSMDGSGGMITKLEAARIALLSGTAMVIGDGTKDNPISRIEEGARCTWFIPDSSPKTARKNWILGTLSPSGTIVADNGALRALCDGKSLLPAGVRSVGGDFERGDAVIIESIEGKEIARGLVAYSAIDAQKIIGHKTDEIETILGYRGRDEIIHRDDLVLS